MVSRSFSTAAATLSFVIFAFCAVSSTKATDVVWKTTGSAIWHALAILSLLKFFHGMVHAKQCYCCNHVISKLKTSPDGGTIHDGGRTIVADNCSSHADFESGPLPFDKADTVKLF
jgi:hypothetical protein